MGALTKRVWLAALCAGLMALGMGPGLAQGAAPDPDFVFFAKEDNPLKNEVGVLPGTGIHNACGLAVDIAGNFYVSDYYHRNVDIFQNTGGEDAFITQLSNPDAEGSACGVALDSTGQLYVNNYHRNVERFTPAPFPVDVSTVFGSATVIDSDEPTGVAVNPTTGDVYVDARDHVAAYDSSGAPTMEIGAASLEDGYGIAISRYLATSGYLYVPDAATDTVKVYNPAVDLDNPIEEIEKPGGFDDLTDSAVAVDRTTGEIYVADHLGPEFAEHPETAIYVFDFAGAFKGRLKFNVIDGSPVGLAVDNSTGANQGRVYVTSGNSEHSSVYAYPPGSATNLEEPAVFSLSIDSTGDGEGSVSSKTAGIECSGTCGASVMAASTLTLTATPEPGSAFEGWSGAGCSGTGACILTMSEATSVSAEFDAPDPAPNASPSSVTPPPASPTIASQSSPASPTQVQRQRAGQRRHAARKRRLAKQRRRAKQRAARSSKARSLR